MPGKLYALLVGIDDYPAPIPKLKGCLNDVAAMETLLRARVADGKFTSPELRLLRNAEATRDAIITGFREHLLLAQQEDVALFYFSGHGSQEKTPPMFLPLEPDGLDETLVCYDSREADKYDLADKEIAVLLNEIGRNASHIVVILDSCHSGSATRAAGQVTPEVRRAPKDDRPRPMESFLFSAAEAQALLAPVLSPAPPTRPAATGKSDWISALPENMIVMSACRADEEAKEYYVAGQNRGAFSYFLTDTIQRTGRSLTYRDLFKRAEAFVKNEVERQTPQVEASHPDQLEQTFLGGAIADNPRYFTLRYSKQYGWVMDGGAVNGILPPTDGEKTTLAIFPLGSETDALRDLSSALASAEVWEVQPHQSLVKVTTPDGKRLPPDSYRAIVTGLPVARLVVRLEGDAAGIERIQAEMTNSLYIREAAPEDVLAESSLRTTGETRVPVSTAQNARLGGHTIAANLRLVAQDNAFHLYRTAVAARLTEPIPGYDSLSARRTVGRLESIARWTLLSRLENPDSRLTGKVRLEVHRITGPPTKRTPGSEPTEPFPPDAEIRITYTPLRAGWKPPEVKIKLINDSAERLYVMLFCLSSDFGVRSWLIGGCERLEPDGQAGSELWARTQHGLAHSASVPEAPWRQGVTEDTALYKLIVCPGVSLLTSLLYRFLPDFTRTFPLVGAAS